MSDFNIVTKDGFEYCDLPLPSGIEKDVLLTEGGCVSGAGKIYGVFDSPDEARKGDEYVYITLGQEALPQELRDLAARNSARL